MGEVRRRFHEELHALEGDVQRTGTKAQLQLEQALLALARRDLAVCDAVIRGDDQVDQLYRAPARRLRPPRVGDNGRQGALAGQRPLLSATPR